MLLAAADGSGQANFRPIDRSFELFGFDLIIDQDWHVWLLEVFAFSKWADALVSELLATVSTLCS